MPIFHGKIAKPAGETPSDLETQVSQAILELEANTDLKAQLRELHITGARQFEVVGKKALVIYVPVPQLKAFQKIQVRLVRELEKKFSGRFIFLLGQRRILPKPTRHSRGLSTKQQRPRSRTLTAVHEMWIQDLCYPAEQVGKRTRYRLDGSAFIKIHLDKQQQTNVEHKLETIAGVYKKMTGKEVQFEFPEWNL
jgi:small subunit ribosomal protein S7e